MTPELQFCLNLNKTSCNITKKLEASLSPHGISFTEFMILHELQHSPNQCLRRIDLADKIGLSPSGVTRLLSPMEKIGLVSKEPNERDARVSLVKLSHAGERIYTESHNSCNERALALVAKLKNKELRAGQDLLAALR